MWGWGAGGGHGHLRRVRRSWIRVPVVDTAGIAPGSVRAEKSDHGAVLRDSGSGGASRRGTRTGDCTVGPTGPAVHGAAGVRGGSKTEQVRRSRAEEGETSDVWVKVFSESWDRASGPCGA